MDRLTNEHLQAVNRPAQSQCPRHQQTPLQVGALGRSYRVEPVSQLLAKDTSLFFQPLTSCAIISSDLSIWIADTGECRQPGPPGQGKELGASRMVNIPSQCLPTGGSVSESNGFCSFCFCSFHKGFHLTHDFPTSSFCSLRKQE